MGYMLPFEQKQIEELYGQKALFRCNDCTLPIWMTQLPVSDPKGGYYPLPARATYGSRYSFPKVTYHVECDRLRRGGRTPVEIRQELREKALHRSQTLAQKEQDDHDLQARLRDSLKRLKRKEPKVKKKKKRRLR